MNDFPDATTSEWLSIVERALAESDIGGVPFVRGGKLFIRVLSVELCPLPDVLEDLVPEGP